MDNIVKGGFRLGLMFALIGLHMGFGYGLWSAWHYGVAWQVLVATLVIHCVRLLVITVGYHRYWTHGAFECHPVIQVLLAIGCCLPLQGSANDWVPDHHQHHRFTDKEGDPHTPKQGFWWSHVLWLAFHTERVGAYRPTCRYGDGWILRWQQRLYWPIGVGLGFVLPWYFWGMPGLLWCGFISVVVQLHSTWCVNSVCHIWGKHPRTLTGEPYLLDDSRNNAVIATITMGEGWHGNHHVKPTAANIGRSHWFDPGWWAIWGLERLGLAWDVRTFEGR